MTDFSDNITDVFFPHYHWDQFILLSSSIRNSRAFDFYYFVVEAVLCQERSLFLFHHYRFEGQLYEEKTRFVEKESILR